MKGHQARARRNILQRLRAAPRSAEAVVEVSAHYRESGIPAAADPVALFAAHARTWQAQVVITSAADWTAELRTILKQKGVRRCAAGRDTPIAADVAAVAAPDQIIWCEAGSPTQRDALFSQAEAGITTTAGGLIETGSLILWPSADEPRLLSLAPPLHIALLHASQLHESWFEALNAQQWAAGMPSNALLITGPSKTADIQRLLVYGAHGPRELVILLLRDA